MKRNIDDLVSAISVNKDFTRDNYFERLYGIQNEMANIVFNDGCTHDVTDITEYFKSICNNNTEQFNNFMLTSARFTGLLEARNIAATCENHVLCKLKKLHSKSRVIERFECMTGRELCKIDAIVFTPKACFILDMINASDKVEILEGGLMSTVFEDGTRKISKNVKERMMFKKATVRRILKENGIDNVVIRPLVVFVDSNDVNTNRCPYITAVESVNMNEAIDGYLGENRFSEEELDHFAKVMEEARESVKFKIPFDLAKFRMSFLLLVLEANGKSSRMSSNREKNDSCILPFWEGLKRRNKKMAKQ